MSIYSELGLSLLALHDARDAASLTLSGQRVAAFADLSGSGRNQVQATAANQPLYVPDAINGRPALRADTATRWMVAQFSAITLPAMTAFFVMSRSNVGQPVSIGSSTSAAPFLRLSTSAFVSQARGNTGSQVNSPTIAGTQSVPNIVMIAFEGTRVIVGLNGVEQETIGTVNPATFDRFALMTNASTTGLGVSNNMIGDLGQVVIIQGLPSLAHRQAVMGDLAWGWGLQSRLPPDHPFANGAPPRRDAAIAGAVPVIGAGAGQVITPASIAGLVPVSGAASGDIITPASIAGLVPITGAASADIVTLSNPSLIFKVKREITTFIVRKETAR